MTNRALSIYMDDHYAMISGELELAQRVAGENSQGELGTFLSSYVRELKTQSNFLDALLASQGQSPSVAKQALSWVAEKLGRLKPNDGGSEYTDLARVLELEVMLTAAQARRLMWKTLNRVLTDADADMARLEETKRTCDDQVKSLKQFHRDALQLAFGPLD